jgi:dienelactone hydrolase
MRVWAGVAFLGASACTPGVGTADTDDATSSSSSTGDPSTTTDPVTTSPTSATTASTSASTTTTTTAADTSSSGDADSSSTGEPFPEPVPDDCITEVSAGHHELTCDGLVYDVEIPPQCLLEPCGMIFDVHGLSMSAQMQNACTNMRALGVEHGFIVVQPNADPPPPAANWIPEVDDAKVFDMMQRTAAAFHVDPDRWHFTGFSQGGFMTWRFACAHADVLASVAPAAACGSDFPITDCQFTKDEAPSDPLDILYMHGTADLVVNWSCAYPRRDAVIAHFGLGDMEVLVDEPDVRRTRWSTDDVTFEMVEHDYTGDSPLAGGHCIPGADDPADAPGQFVPVSCDDPFEMVWGHEVVQFFLEHRKGD